MDNPECRWLGIETRSVTRSTERTSFPVPRLTAIPNTLQYAWYATKTQPSMHNAMKMRCLEMRAHGHANRENDIRNANDMEIWYGLTLTWESLSHTHTRDRWMKMKRLEMRAHGHANRGNGLRNANDMKIWYGLKLTWESLCHTHIRGRLMKKIWIA